MKPSHSYYAVIFSAQRTAVDDGYGAMASEMEALAEKMPGYIGFESARNDDGFGIAVSYWESEAAIKEWKNHVDHTYARKRGRETWYSDYMVRVAKVERAYRMKRVEEQV